VAVSFRGGEGGRASLCVRDNGVGLPAGFDPERSHSLGLRLVRLLAVQLRADLRMESDGGTTFTITLENGPTD
jgi:two-component sensor histidine kinase